MSEQAPILVVEDNENDAMLIGRGLTNACIPNPKHFVKTGEEAVHYLQGVELYSDRKRYPLPALILLDLKLPGMDGFEVLKWIRSQHQFRELRVLVLTCSSEVRDVNRAYQLGANSFLIKPLEFESVRALFSTISWHLWNSESIAGPQPLPPRTATVE